MRGFTYGFYDSLDHDRRYNALQISSIFDGIIEDGVYFNILDQFKVVPGEGLNVIVKPGRAWFNHTWTLNTVDQVLAIPTANPSYPRWDAVSLTINTTRQGYNARSNYLEIIQGEADIDPQKPASVNTEFIFKHILAYVYVPAAATNITKIQINVGANPGVPFVANALHGGKFDASGWFKDWEVQFEKWFAGVKDIYASNDAIGYLSNQIENCVKYTDPGAGAIGDIRISARNLEAESMGDWIPCEGQELSVSKYQKLFDVIGKSDRKSVEYRQTSNVLMQEFTVSNILTRDDNPNGRTQDGTVQIKSLKYGLVQLKNGKYVMPIHSDNVNISETDAKNGWEFKNGAIVVFDSTMNVESSCSFYWTNSTTRYVFPKTNILAIFPTENIDEVGVIVHEYDTRNLLNQTIDLYFYNTKTKTKTKSSYSFKPTHNSIKEQRNYWSFDNPDLFVTETAVYIGLYGSISSYGNLIEHGDFLIRYKFSDRSFKGVVHYSDSNMSENNFHHAITYRYLMVSNDKVYFHRTDKDNDDETDYYLNRSTVDSEFDKITSGDQYYLVDFTFKLTNIIMFTDPEHNMFNANRSYSFGPNKYYIGKSTDPFIYDASSKTKDVYPYESDVAVIYEDDNRYYFCKSTENSLSLSVYTKKDKFKVELANPTFVMSEFDSVEAPRKQEKAYNPTYVEPYLLPNRIPIIGKKGDKYYTSIVTPTIDDASTFRNINMTTVSGIKAYIRAK